MTEDLSLGRDLSPVQKTMLQNGWARYILEGEPIPLKRHRHNQRRAYDSQRHLKLTSTLALTDQHGTRPLMTGPLLLDITFFFSIPKTRIKSLRPGSFHHFKPDLDNLIKYICDVSTKIIYEDDSCVASINARKRYNVEPRTEIWVGRI